MSSTLGHGIYLSFVLSSLISRMLRRVPTERLSLDSVLGHPWLQDTTNLRNATPHPLGPNITSSTPWITPLANRWQPPPQTSTSGGSRTAPSSPNPVQVVVQRDTLSDADHCFIVQRIVDGKIATRDQILQYVNPSFNS